MEEVKCPCPGLQPCDMIHHPLYASNLSFRSAVDAYLKWCGEVEGISETIKNLNSRRMRFSYDIELQSASEGIVSESVTQETLTDVPGGDIETGQVGQVLRPGQVSVLKTTPVHMDDFFSRPMQIARFTVSLATPVASTYDVWNLYFSNPAVRAKLRNFGFIRPGKLKIRINVAGSPFHYGRLLFAYWPFDNYNDLMTPQVAAAAQFQGNVYLSQFPGSVIYDVKRNVPFDMSIPYISPKPMASLFNEAATVALPTATNISDLSGLGKLYVRTINNIASVSSTPTALSVYIYAWLDDVELGCPTGSQTIITTESGDEREVGPLEEFSSRAVEISDALSSVPVLSPWARASSMMFSGLGSLAALLGWSVPTVISRPHLIKNMPFQNSAQTIGNDTGFRITLDPKQEVSVDPRSAGSDHDDMVISEIARRESLLDTFTWTRATAPLSGSLWQSIVAPMVGKQIGTNNYVQPTALCFAAMPFGYWRGTIKFRFEIVCSAFHRGKIGVYYDPNVAQEVLIDANLSPNKVFMKVIDIQETQSFEVCIDWAFPRHWCRNFTSRSSITGTCGTTITNPQNYSGWCNGYIGVTPMNQLQSPDSSDISVNVYISCDDLQVQFFNSKLLPTSNTLVQSGEEIDLDKSNSSVPVSCFTLNPTGASTANIIEEAFGEQPLSFRSLLKRFVTVYTNSAASTATATGYITITGDIHPGLVPRPALNVSTPGFNSYPVQTLISYLRYGYLGMRGGYKYRVRVTSLGSDGVMNNVKASLINPDTVSNGNTFTITSASTPAINNAECAGTVSYAPFTNAGIEFEVPYYSNNLFLLSCNSDPYGVAAPIMDTYACRSWYVRYETGQTVTSMNLYVEGAAAEDFSLMTFLGAPAFRVT